MTRRCDVCGGTASVHEDHCPDCGELRGWLCYFCAAMEHLATHDHQEVVR